MVRLAIARKIFLADQQIRTAKHKTKATDQYIDCQKFGYIAKFCKNETICQTCAENHNNMDCINDIIECTKNGKNYGVNPGFRTIHMYEPAVQTKQFNPIQMLVILKSFNSILRPDRIERIAKD
jgi:hypothetical protein